MHLGIDARREVIPGESLFFECTKGFHKAMQGNQINLDDRHLRIYDPEDNISSKEASSMILTFSRRA